MRGLKFRFHDDGDDDDGIVGWFVRREMEEGEGAVGWSYFVDCNYCDVVDGEEEGDREGRNDLIAFYCYYNNNNYYYYCRFLFLDKGAGGWLHSYCQLLLGGGVCTGNMVHVLCWNMDICSSTVDECMLTVGSRRHDS